MTSYGSIPQNDRQNTTSPTTWSSKTKITVAILLAVIIALVIFYPQEEIEPVESFKSWPTVVYSGAGSDLSAYRGTLGNSGGSTLASGRPTTTAQATVDNWINTSDECVQDLGYPWTFNGAVTKEAPVTLYFSKQTQHGDGKLTGIAIHYFDGVVPEKLIEDLYFSKGIDYDTIKVAFRDEDTDVCGEEPLPENGPHLDVVLAEGKGRKSLPTTEDVAEESGEWARGSCLTDMGRHWEHDIVGGSNITFDAANLFPVVPMFDIKDGSLNAIFFEAPAPMQNWDSTYCGNLFAQTPHTHECLEKANMWDSGNGGLRQEIVGPFYMCANFCSDTCDITGATGDPPRFTTMHWFFKHSTNITACTTNAGPTCSEKV